MPAADSFADTFTALTAGDQQAARLIYQRFVDRLIHLAARTLDRRLGAKTDPESVALSAFESFFERQRNAEFSLHNWGMVFGLLSHIAFRKCLNRNRDLRRQRRDDGGATEFEDWQAAASGPGPADEAAVADCLDLALAGFDADERQVLDAYLVGSTPDRVAEQVGLSTRTVQRILERFRRRLLDLLEVE